MLLPAQLPCILETHKTYDDNFFYKSGEIGQVSNGANLHSHASRCRGLCVCLIKQWVTPLVFSVDLHRDGQGGRDDDT